MRLSESQFILQSIFVCSLCPPCSLVLKDLKEAVWISIHLIRYLSLFTLFTLFTCSWGFKCRCLNLHYVLKVFLFVHLGHLVHLFSRIWKRPPESQFIWLGIWVCSLCSHCSLVLEDLYEAVWISIHFKKYFCLFILFTLFTCSQGFERGCLNLTQFIWLGIWVCSLCSLCSPWSPCSFVLEELNEAAWILLHFTKYFSLFTLFIMFSCSWEFERGRLNLKTFD